MDIIKIISRLYIARRSGAGSTETEGKFDKIPGSRQSKQSVTSDQLRSRWTFNSWSMCRGIYNFCIIMLWVLLVLPTGSPHYCEEEAEATIILVSARRPVFPTKGHFANRERITIYDYLHINYYAHIMLVSSSFQTELWKNMTAVNMMHWNSFNIMPDTCGKKCYCQSFPDFLFFWLLNIYI